jgi:small subunit ribosomal protein S8
MVNDKISDMLTRIRNANLARHNSTFVFYCKSNLEILEIFFKEGYIESYSYDDQLNLKKFIKVVL